MGFNVNVSNSGSVVTLLSVTESFFAGIKDAVSDNLQGISQIIMHPIKSVEMAAFLLVAVSVDGSPYNQMLREIIDKELDEIVKNFKNGDGNLKARYLGRAFGEVMLGLALDKGVEKALELIKPSKLSDVLERIGIVKGKKVEAKEVVSLIEKEAEAVTIAKNSISALRNSIRDGEIVLKLADGRIFKPQKIAMAIDSTDAGNIMRRTYGFNRVWDANPSIGDDIVDVVGKNSKEIAELYTENNLRTLYDNSFIDDLFAKYPEHFSELGVTKNEIITEMDKFRGMLRDAKAEAAAKSTIKAPDGTPSFGHDWSIENCAEVWAVRNAILSGVKLDNIMLRTINYSTGAFAELCENCQRIFKRFISSGKIIRD